MEYLFHSISFIAVPRPAEALPPAAACGRLSSFGGFLGHGSLWIVMGSQGSEHPSYW